MRKQGRKNWGPLNRGWWEWWTLRVLHRWPFHPGLNRITRMQFQPGACLLCSWATRDWEDVLPSFRDQSSIVFQEPTEEMYGITMTATAMRQLEAIKEEDPEGYEEIMKHMQEVAAEAAKAHG